MSTDYDFDAAPADFLCSIIREARDTATQDIGFRDALSGIRTGRWAKAVEAVRLAYASGGKEAAAGPKKLLPGILFSGTFSRRSSEALTKASGLICADLDGLNETVETWFEQITADPHTLACFRSPSGTGLKVVMRIDPARPHIESFHAAEHHMLESFGLQIDEKCSDVSRICFVSHDPELFATDDATPLTYPPPAPKVVKEFTLPPREDDDSDLSPGDDFNLRGAQMVPDLLRAHGWTHLRGKYWCRPGKTGDVSASWCHYPNTLHVFSSAPETGFPSDRKGFDPFAIYAHLECRGDFSAAARDLGRKGYGAMPKAPKTRTDLRPPDEAVGQGADAETAPPAPTEDELEKKRVTLSSKPVEPTTRLYLARKPIATPGNLTTLISKAKTGKTATIGGVVAAIVAAHYDRSGLDTLGFTAPHTKEAVLLIDTEQSPYDAYTCHQRAFARAGQDSDVDWMMHYALVGMSALQLRLALPKLLDKAKLAHGAVFTVILDGVADFVASVNDEAESNEFITWLRKLAVDYNCPIICVIHSNEAQKAGDDGRGHLGKQLTRKAESNLLLKKNGEVTTITSEKQRKAPITEKDGIAFQWSDEYQRHVSCQKIPTEVKGGRPKFNFDTFQSIFPRTADKAMTKLTLLRFAQELASIKETAFRELLHEATEDGTLIRTPKAQGFVYHLNVPPLKD